MENPRPKDVVQRFVSKGVFPHHLAFTLLLPVRSLIFSPQELVKRLLLQAHHHVLEVGCGPGYFSIRVARSLPQGKLVMADIQHEMLNIARRRLKRRGIENVEFYLCDGSRFDFTNETFDRIFLVTVLGEVENKSVYMDEFYRLLKPGGILSVTELAGDPDKLTPAQVMELAESSGFKNSKEFGNRRNYTINFTK